MNTNTRRIINTRRICPLCTPRFCPYCHARKMNCNDHTIDECLALAAHICGKCGMKGHTRGKCTKGTKGTEGTEGTTEGTKGTTEGTKGTTEGTKGTSKPANSWAALVDKKIDNKMRERVDAANTAAHLAAEKKAEERRVAKQLKATERKENALKIAMKWCYNMEDMFGVRWFYHVDEKLIPRAALNECLSLQWKNQHMFEEEQERLAYEFEDMMDQHIRELNERRKQEEAEYEHKKATLSPKEFAKWEKIKEREDKEELYAMDDHLAYLQEEERCRYQNYVADHPQYYAHYLKTGQMLEPIRGTKVLNDSAFGPLTPPFNL